MSATPWPLLVGAFLALAAVIVQSADPTADTCTIGQTWVSNYIKFECYTSGQIVKGVRPIGCVPNNTATGAVIAAGQTYNSPTFVYQCSQPSSNRMEYKIIACIDTAGNTLNIGENRTMANYALIECIAGPNGQVQYKKTSANGCIYNGQIQALGSVYLSNETTTVNVNGTNVLIGVGTGYRCLQLGNGTFVNTPQSCVLPNQKNGVNLGTYGVVGDVVVKCTTCDPTASNPFGQCRLSVVPDDSVACKINGETFKYGTIFNTTTGDKSMVSMVCNWGVSTCRGCWVNNVLVAYNTVGYVNGVPSLCYNGGPGFWDLLDKGCKLDNGTVVPYNTQWYTADARYLCTWSRTTYNLAMHANNITAVIVQNACLISGVAIGVGKTAMVSGVPYICANNGTMFVAMVMNQTTGSSSSVNGEGGSGDGNGFTAGATTTTTRRIEPKTAAAEVEVTTTESTTAAAVGNCEDSFKFCSSLAPVCQSPGSAVLQVREILSKTNITTEDFQKIYGALHLEGENDKLKSEAEDVFAYIIGGSKEDDSPCGCSEEDDDCRDRCQSKSSCKRCGIFKRKLRDLVKLACPQTCNTCGNPDHMPQLVQILVRFYSHDCE